MAEAIIAPPQFHTARAIGASFTQVHGELLLALSCGHSLRREGFLPMVQPKDLLGGLWPCQVGHEK